MPGAPSLCVSPLGGSISPALGPQALGSQGRQQPFFLSSAFFAVSTRSLPAPALLVWGLEARQLTSPSSFWFLLKDGAVWFSESISWKKEFLPLLEGLLEGIVGPSVLVAPHHRLSSAPECLFFCLLKYIWFIILCQFQVYSILIQYFKLYSYRLDNGYNSLLC